MDHNFHKVWYQHSKQVWWINMHTFVANFLGYATTKNYWNWIIFSQVIAKVKRVTFFWNTVYTPNQQRFDKNIFSFITSSFHFASAVVSVESSHMTASLSTSWRSLSPPSSFLSGHVSTMWFMVCRWPQSQESDGARLHLCRFAWYGPWPVQK